VSDSKLVSGNNSTNDRKAQRRTDFAPLLISVYEHREDGGTPIGQPI